MSKKNQLVPNHIAIIMDGNGRWATSRHMPRYLGHSEGAKSVEKILNAAIKSNIKYLTLFAFSSENIYRPQAEISFLKKLFYKNISEKLDELHKNNINLKFIGNLEYFGKELVEKMAFAEDLTKNNSRIFVSIALNYGGRWDIVQACNKLIQNKVPGLPLTESDIHNNLVTGGMPDPDLLIRTSGEMRISNFLLWQFAYTEMYFSDRLWPDFDENDFQAALNFYATRNRRFGLAAVDATQSETN